MGTDRSTSMGNRFGRYGGAIVALSIAACYGTLAFVALLSVAGVAVDVHEGAWAAAIVVLVWLAAVAIAVGFPGHRGPGPAVLAVIGASLVTWVMLDTFIRMLEILGFACLVAAALWDRRLRREREAPG